MKNKVLKVIIIISVILLSIFIHSKVKNKEYFDDIFIFNLYQNKKEQNPRQANYKFDIEKQTELNVNVNLCDTVFSKTQLEEKIAPGVKGEFSILINCQKAKTDIIYQIDFESKNNKPKNLLFNIKESKEKYSNLEDLEKVLKGIIEKENSKTITIEWSWEYENSENGDMQDTLDGKNMNTYNFDINILADEV